MPWADDHGEPLISWPRLITLPLIVGGSMWAASLLSPTEAAYRIEVRACIAGQCAMVPTPPNAWDGLYACQTREQWVADAAAEILSRQPMGLPSPWEVTAKCVPADGKPRA